MKDNLVNKSKGLVNDLVNDCISRAAAIQTAERIYKRCDTGSIDDYHDLIVEALAALPPAQPERDIPMKPGETIDRSWGIPERQGVCPRCDHYLGRVAFLGDGKKVTYCETCGQAIDWEGWGDD